MNAPPNPLDVQVRLRVAMGNGMRSEYWGAFEERYHVQEVSSLLVIVYDNGHGWMRVNLSFCIQLDVNYFNYLYVCVITKPR
ncbi:hypothetical protein EON63_02115 [archaeon]|nr:MAG: hypothetical protein EON63_02115 [archaeon]